MATAPLASEGIPFNVKQHGPLQGTVSKIDGNLADMPDSQLQALAEANNKVSKLAGKIPDDHYGFLMKVKGNNPSFAWAGGPRIAKEVAADYEHVRFAKQGQAEGRLLAFPTTDGNTEYGVVSGEQGALKREGLWTTVDKAGVRRAQGYYISDVAEGMHREYHPDGKHVAASVNYKAGVPDGPAFKYNAKSEPILKTTYDNGEVKDEKVIDPVQYNADKQKERAEKQALRSIKF